MSIGSCSFRDSTARPDVFADLVEDLADFLDGAGAEGDADIVDAAGGVEVEIEIGVGAAEPADIDDAALDLGCCEILVRDLAGDLVDDQVDAFAIGRLQHLVDPAGIAGIHREVGAELLQPAAAHRVRGRADHEFCALEFCDLHRHQPDAGAGALDQHGLARLQRAVGDDGIVHGGERDGEGGGFLEIHVRGRAEQPAVVGQRIFGERRAARAHDLVADLDALGVGAELGDFAGPFHAEHGADAAGRAMHMALGHAEIGAVEAAGVDLDQHLRALRRRFCNVGDFSAVGAVDIGFHGSSLLLRGSGAAQFGGPVVHCWQSRAPIRRPDAARPTSCLRAGSE